MFRSFKQSQTRQILIFLIPVLFLKKYPQVEFISSCSSIFFWESSFFNLLYFIKFVYYRAKINFLWNVKYLTNSALVPDSAKFLFLASTFNPPFFKRINFFSRSPESAIFFFVQPRFDEFFSLSKLCNMCSANISNVFFHLLHLGKETN